MHVKHAVAGVVLIATVALLASTAGAQASPRDSMLAEINTTRAAYGLRPLRPSPALQGASQRYALRMMRGGFFAHASRLLMPGFNTVGEVLEKHSGRRPRVRGTLQAWMNSPGHRAILLTGSYRWIGLGQATGTRSTVWVGRLGR